MFVVIHKTIKDIVVNIFGYVRCPTRLSFEIVMFLYGITLFVFLINL